MMPRFSELLFGINQTFFLFQNPSKAEIRDQLKQAMEEGDDEAISSAMQKFVEQGLDDKGDLAKAKRKFLLSRMNTGCVFGYHYFQRGIRSSINKREQPSLDSNLIFYTYFLIVLKSST